MGRKRKTINFNLQMQSWAQRDNWPASNHTGDMLEETWPCSSATACRLGPAFNLFPPPALSPPPLQHCSNMLLEPVHQLGRGSQLAVPGPLPSGSIKNCFHDYSTYASREQAFGRMFILHRSFIWLGYLLITCIEELPSLVANKTKLLNPALCNPIYLLYQINLYHICKCVGKVT